MRRIDQEKALERLDEIKALTSIPGKDGGAIAIGLPGIDGEALDLTVRVARRKGGVALLVEKYSNSRSVIILGALCGVLGQCAEKKSLTNAYLFFEFIEKLQRKDSPALMGGILSSIKAQIGVAKVWQHSKMPDSFYPFLQHCLKFTSPKAKWAHRGLSDWVELGAIDLLWTMCEQQIYNLNFDQNQRKWIEDKIREIAIANPDNETFQRNASYFFNCVAKE